MITGALAIVFVFLAGVFVGYRILPAESRRYRLDGLEIAADVPERYGTGYRREFLFLDQRDLARLIVTGDDLRIQRAGSSPNWRVRIFRELG